MQKIRQGIEKLDQKMKTLRLTEILPAILVIVFLYGILQFFGITCPIKYLTGVSCAGCGMTRAWIALFHLDFKGAFYYHPLFFIPPIAAIFIMCKSKINNRVYRFLIFTFIMLFGIIYLFRILNGNDDIVVFHPKDGAIFRLFRYINK